MTHAGDSDTEALLVCVSGTDVLGPPSREHGPLWLARDLPVPEELDRHLVGEVDGVLCWAIDADRLTHLPPQAPRMPLARLHRELDPPLFKLVSGAVQSITWVRTSQFCGRCGTANIRSAEHHAYVCPACGLLAFPRLAPAVIVLIGSAHRILLARSPTFPEPFYAPLAGFVEPAETLEQAVRREVREEVGLEVDNICYFASQPWPYPHTLLAAFTATARSTDVRLNRAELLDAAWFGAEDLPLLPPKLSISRELIDDWVTRTREAA